MWLTCQGTGTLVLNLAASNGLKDVAMATWDLIRRPLVTAAHPDTELAGIADSGSDNDTNMNSTQIPHPACYEAMIETLAAVHDVK